MKQIKYIYLKLLHLLLQFRRFARNQFQKFFTQLNRAERIATILAAILIGSLGAFGAIGFRYIIKLSHRLFFGTFEYSIEFLEGFAWYHILILPALGGLIVGVIIHFLAPEVKGSGVPEVMESIATKGGIIRLRVLIAKALAAAITIGSGGSAGREGPIIHIGSAIGSAFGQLTGLSPRKLRTFVACGAASGIAATFNAPIAGALFAVEVIIGDFAVPQFSPIVISSVVATVLSRHFIGDFPAFEVPPYEFVSSIEFIPYTIVGVTAGLIAVLFINTVDKTHNMFENLSIPEYLKPAIGGLVIGSIAIAFPQVFGVGYESINDALWGRDISWLLLVLLFVKVIGTSVTLGSGGSGGIFAPSLFIGAMLGALIGTQAQVVFPGQVAEVGAYALVGMGALVSATTHAPITAILIIFEMTNDYRIIPPLMLATIVSVLLASYLKKESMYTMKLVRKGINIFEGKDINLLKSLTVKSTLNTNTEIIKANTSFTELLNKFVTSEHDVVLVVDNNNELRGTITLPRLKEFFLDKDIPSEFLIAADLTETNIDVLYEDDSLDLAMHQFGKKNVDELPVVKDKTSNQVIGSVRRMDIINAYNKEIFKLDLSGGMHSIMKGVHEERDIEISAGVKLVEVEPPTKYFNRSIKELNIRVLYGLEIIMIRHMVETKDGIKDRPGILPTADYIIKPGDRLLVLGKDEDIANFKKQTTMDCKSIVLLMTKSHSIIKLSFFPSFGLR